MNRWIKSTEVPVKHCRFFSGTLYEITTRVHCTSHFFEGTRKTRPCLTGHPDLKDWLSAGTRVGRGRVGGEGGVEPQGGVQDLQDTPRQ